MFKFGKHAWQIGFHPTGVFGARDACDADGLQLRVLFKDVRRGGFHEHHGGHSCKTQHLHDGS